MLLLTSRSQHTGFPFAYRSRAMARLSRRTRTYEPRAPIDAAQSQQSRNATTRPPPTSVSHCCLRRRRRRVSVAFPHYTQHTHRQRDGEFVDKLLIKSLHSVYSDRLVRRRRRRHRQRSSAHLHNVWGPRAPAQPRESWLVGARDTLNWTSSARMPPLLPLLMLPSK